MSYSLLDTTLKLVSLNLRNQLVLLKIFFFSNFSVCFWSRYTAVGVFVLGRMFREAWGNEAGKKQAEFNEYLEVLFT